ncbi:MAG: DUF3341 domain-containing protein [Acidobacteriota bacterium]
MASSNTPTARLHGVMAEFDSADALVAALEVTKKGGYDDIDAFSPFPIEPASEIVCNHKKSHVSKIVLAGGLTGATLGFGGQTWMNVVSYPMNIGGRPFFSWPAFIPVTFELTILLAAFSGVIGMILLNGLPQPYHPVFNVEAFGRATLDRYFLIIESTDAKYDEDGARSFLQGLDGVLEVHDVDW